MLKYISISRPPVIRVSDKVMIPQDEHPDINFVGLLIGPRGNTLKCRFKLLIFIIYVINDFKTKLMLARFSLLIKQRKIHINIF